MAFKIYIILLIASALGTCFGRRQRIVGGKAVNIQDYPYQVSIRLTQYDPPYHICGGSIITKNHILTAAHCFEGRLPHALPHIEVYAGTSTSDYGGNNYSISKVTIHPDFMFPDIKNDIAVVTLQESIEFNEFQKPIKLPSRNVPSGSIGVITGWGSLNHYKAGDYPINLQMALVKIYDNTHCPKDIRIPESQVCTLQRVGVGTCGGDSGGPLVANDELVGVDSYGLSEDCAAGIPDIFTNVYYYIDFIQNVINTRSY